MTGNRGFVKLANQSGSDSFICEQTNCLYQLTDAFHGFKQLFNHSLAMMNDDSIEDEGNGENHSII